MGSLAMDSGDHGAVSLGPWKLAARVLMLRIPNLSTSDDLRTAPRPMTRLCEGGNAWAKVENRDYTRVHMQVPHAHASLQLIDLRIA